MQRRGFLSRLAAGVGVAGVQPAFAFAATETFEVTRTEAQWRAMLTPLQYAVMREDDTERAFSSPLNREKRNGDYLCRGCDLPLYSSAHKFDSGTGWPSFWKAREGAVGYRKDRSFFMTRTEVHCRRCGSHLGHVFNDGPPPTGKRHCLNGASLVFRPA